jgi:hypothetical protein
VAEPDRLQPGESVAAAGATDAGRHVVAKQLAAAVGEDRRTVELSLDMLEILVAQCEEWPAQSQRHALVGERRI